MCVKKRKLAIYAALLKALNTRAYEKWFDLQLREELLRRLPSYCERGYEYEAKIEATIFNAYYSGKLYAGFCTYVDLFFFFTLSARSTDFQPYTVNTIRTR